MAETLPLNMDNNIEIDEIPSSNRTRSGVRGPRNFTGSRIPDNVPSMEISDVPPRPDMRQIHYYEEAAQNAEGQATGSKLLKHRNTLSRPERRASRQQRNLVAHDLPPPVRAGATTLRRQKQQVVVQKKKRMTVWECFSKTVTCCICSCCLKSCGGMPTPAVQQAWREKVTLCLICLVLMIITGFITFAMQKLACESDGSSNPVPWAVEEGGNLRIQDKEAVLIGGTFYQIKSFNNVFGKEDQFTVPEDMKNVDLTHYFADTVNNSNSKCKKYIPAVRLACKGNGGACLSTKKLSRVQSSGKQIFNWDHIDRITRSKYRDAHKLVVYSNFVMNLTDFFNDYANDFMDKKVVDVLKNNVGKDVTFQLSKLSNKEDVMECIKEHFVVGYISNSSMFCLGAQAFSVIFVVVILGIVLTKFFMAVIFHWIVADRFISKNVNGGNALQDSNINLTSTIRTKSYHSSQNLLDEKSMAMINNNSSSSTEEEDDGLLYTMCLVTCYSEGEQGIHGTLNSLASTTYQDDHKLIFVIADGIIRGEGNTRYTPDIICGLMKEDKTLPRPQPQSYIAIASGEKQHNMAKVHAGYFISDDRKHCVPIINVVKCGTPGEARSAKPGNRGKRDSQLILMNFLSRVMFNDRMTPLDFDLCTRIRHIAKVNPDQYELVLMVDADTKVKPSSLSYMVRAMYNDNLIMGLCGETRIANKHTSFWTMIQVFEYYISHHLAKGFESMFGGVTCLPGCFCMYRVKARKGLPGYYVPILANPDIVEEYSENIVDTLHKKNLLLLGEDRFLTTLMLKTFPKRKMVFIPHAQCKTIVPDTFKVLLSQRRRWINSTIHNLLELVLVRDLCGTFCFSMQFVVAIELAGTVVLPAAICFTIYLVLYTIISQRVEWIPILMLVAILGLPGVLIVLTSFKWNYVGWMLIYLFSLPIWNLVLPSYAMWHFDDFSWGETRKVQGSGKDDHGKKDGEFDSTSVPLKHWAEYEKERLGIKSNSVYTPGAINYNNTLRSGSVNTNPTNTAASQVIGITHRTTSGQANLSTNPAVLRAVQLQQKQAVQMQLARQNNPGPIRRFSSTNSSSSASPLISSNSIHSKSSTAISSLSNKSSSNTIDAMNPNGKPLNPNSSFTLPPPNYPNSKPNNSNNAPVINNNPNSNPNPNPTISFNLNGTYLQQQQPIESNRMINELNSSTSPKSSPQYNSGNAPRGNTGTTPRANIGTVPRNIGTIPRTNVGNVPQANTSTSPRINNSITHLNVRATSPPPIPPSRKISKQ